MKAADFDYVRPSALADALALMADDSRDVAALAGGQSLVPMMNFRLATPDVLLDLSALAELRGLTDHGDRIRVGAMTRYAELAALPGLDQSLPLMARALPHIAHSAIRNRGTLGGSVALADPAAEVPAVLVALGATIHLASGRGAREIGAEDFFLGHYDTARHADELVIAIDIPKAVPTDRFAFYELARRHGDYAMAGVAIAWRQTPRITFFSVADRPIRAQAAETILGAQPTALDAACASLTELDVNGDLNGGPRMKRHLAAVVLRRAWDGIET